MVLDVQTYAKSIFSSAQNLMIMIQTAAVFSTQYEELLILDMKPANAANPALTMSWDAYMASIFV